MQFDPQQSLQLAFRHLDSFTVAGLGTFVQKRVGAKIDHQTKRVLPPQEQFVLESDENQTAALPVFFERYYAIDAAAAAQLNADIGTFVTGQLEQNGYLAIEGYGRLRKEEGLAAEFIPEASLFGQSNDFFGLQAVDFTVGEAGKPSLEKKKAAAQTSNLANQNIVEPAPPKRRFPMGWLVFLLFVGILSTAGWYFQDELQSQIEKMGWFSQSGAEVDPKPATDPVADRFKQDSIDAVLALAQNDSLAATMAMQADSIRKADSLNALAVAKVEPKPVAKVEPKPVAKVEPKPVAKVEPKPVAKVEPKPVAKVEPKPVAKVEPKPVAKVEPKPVAKVEPKPVAKVEPKPIANNIVASGIGIKPTNGHYYLVVASTENGTEAQQIANGVSGGGIVIAPYGGKGFYKVAAFESSNKSQVIQKMVALKDKYTKSWIYWPGM